ncbi:hypothetical protein HYW21_05830 [Candidatus Woesearchaeota archaeon]|nr:hypothetical protein [Candidatus Woesearchaeota archaeon]
MTSNRLNLGSETPTDEKLQEFKRHWNAEIRKIDSSQFDHQQCKDIKSSFGKGRGIFFMGIPTYETTFEIG